MKYEKMIFPDEKKVKAAEKQEAVEDAQTEMYNAIAAAKKAVRERTKEVDRAKRTVPFNPADVINANYELEGANSVLKELEDLNAELF